MIALKNRVALVTGAGSGIGRATALAFARAGARVVASDIATTGLDETIQLIEEDHHKAIGVRADVSKDADMRRVVEEAMGMFGRLDFAHNNAGIEGATAPLVSYPEDVFDKVLSVNLKGVWLGMKHEIPRILESGGGAIVNTASIAGLVGFPNAIAYTAAKHGVVGLTRAAALEYGKQGIRVNAVCPGVIATPMIDRATASDPRMLDALKAGHPIGRLGRPEEIANAVVWLCSSEASFVTGHALTIDGGWVAQ